MKALRTLGLLVSLLAAHGVAQSSAGLDADSQPSSAMLMLAGLVLLGGVIHRRCSADSDRA